MYDKTHICGLNFWIRDFWGVGFWGCGGDLWGHNWRIVREILGCFSYSFGSCLGVVEDVYSFFVGCFVRRICLGSLFPIFSYIFIYFTIFYYIFIYFFIFSYIFIYFHIFSYIFIYFVIFFYILCILLYFLIFSYIFY